ncbi:MAG TPA: ABC transporter permease [Verrucomicrobiae bacterium]|jgi:ribose transport system permease protein|nr:ABC transporter permease [Verrucomicrobiae bacterium]
MKKELGIFILLVVLCGVTAGMNPRFLSAANLSNMANIIGMFGIFSIGTGLVIITGGIDLSVGSMVALLGVLLSMALVEWHWAWPVAAGFVILVAIILGSLHGFLITRFNMQPFIVTLCGLLIYRGAARFIAHDSTKGFDGTGFETLHDLAHGKLFGVPAPFIMLLAVAVIMWLVLHRSVYGRYLMAVGGNEVAARFSGINTRWVIASSYIIAGLLTGVSSVLFAFYSMSVAPSNAGNFYELYGIAAAVLGGCSLLGGEGSIIGIVIGTALLQVLQNLVNLLGIDSSLNFAVMGAVVLLGVLTDQVVKARAARRG